MERQQLGRQKEEAEEEEVDDNDDDVNFDRKLDIITAGARPFVKDHLLTKITKENCINIVSYMLRCRQRLEGRRQHD